MIKFCWAEIFENVYEVILSNQHIKIVPIDCFLNIFLIIFINFETDQSSILEKYEVSSHSIEQ